MADQQRIASIGRTIAAIETALADRAGAAGLVRVALDGVVTEYDWDQAVATLDFWRRELSRAQGTRRMVRGLDLRNA